jgi:transposase InsO family protein
VRWEAKVVPAVDDHSRYCVSGKVVEHATSRAVCLAFAEALVRFGVPQEVLTDNGKQFTDRFGKGGEVLFDKICRKNEITHRLPAPASSNQNGKVERFHGTFSPHFLDQVGPFTSIERSPGRGGRLGRALRRRATPPGPGRQSAGHARGTLRPEADQDRALVHLWLPPTLVRTPRITTPRPPMTMTRPMTRPRV